MTLSNGLPPFYSERPSAAFADPSQLYLGYAAVAVFVGLLLVLPGVRGRERIYFILRWSVSLFIGTSIVACVQGNSWHVSIVEGDMPFKVKSEEMVKFKVGLMIGLSGFNVTLSGTSGKNVERDFRFNEEFYFLEADKGMDRILMRGLPFPILNVVEHFSVNRVSSIWLWGRRYWVAGHYGYYLLWSAFVSWIITNVLFHTVLRYGGLLLAFTGLLLIGANVSFLSITSHGCELEVHLGYYEDIILRPTYGWSFWLCLSVGCCCIFFGTTVFFSDHLCSKALRRVFNMKKEKDSQLEDVDIHSVVSGASDEYHFQATNKSYYEEERSEMFPSKEGSFSGLESSCCSTAEFDVNVQNYSEEESSSASVNETRFNTEKILNTNLDVEKIKRHSQVSFELDHISNKISKDKQAIETIEGARDKITSADVHV